MLQGAGPSQAGRKPEKVSTPVPTNVFTRTPQGTLGFTTYQVRVLTEDRNDTQDAVLYLKFTKIRDGGHLKANIPVIRIGISFGDIRINCPQELTWWVTDLTLWGKKKFK